MYKQIAFPLILAILLLGSVEWAMAQKLSFRKKQPAPVQISADRYQLDAYPNLTDTLRFVTEYEPTKPAGVQAVTVMAPTVSTLGELSDPASQQSKAVINGTIQQKHPVPDLPRTMSVHQTIYRRNVRPQPARLLRAANSPQSIPTTPGVGIGTPVSDLERVLKRKKQMH